jgi:hypothetical protein
VTAALCLLLGFLVLCIVFVWRHYRDALRDLYSTDEAVVVVSPGTVAGLPTSGSAAGGGTGPSSTGTPGGGAGGASSSGVSGSGPPAAVAAAPTYSGGSREEGAPSLRGGGIPLSPRPLGNERHPPAEAFVIPARNPAFGIRSREQHPAAKEE